MSNINQANKMTITVCLSTTTLNVNKLNASIKIHTIATGKRKQYLYVCCLQETQVSLKDTQFESKGIENIVYAPGNKQKFWGRKIYLYIYVQICVYICIFIYTYVCVYI